MAPGHDGTSRLRFRFIAVTCDEAFFVPVRRGMRDAAAMLNADVDFTGSQGVDAAEMCRQARDAIASGYHGLAITIFDAEAFRSVVAEAHAAGVPVVAFNIDHQRGGAGNLAGIVQDFAAAGKILGERAARALRPGGKVLLTLHDPGISALEERRDAIMASLTPLRLAWTELITTHDPDVASGRVGAFLEADPEIIAVLATGQADTEGAALAAERLGRPVYVAGFDLSPTILRLIRQGVLDFTLDQQPYAQGFYPVMQLALAVRLGIVPTDMDAGAAIVDRNNVMRVGDLSERGFR